MNPMGRIPSLHISMLHQPGVSLLTLVQAVEARGVEDPAGARHLLELSRADLAEPLDTIQDPDQVFGSYDALTRDARFHYEPRGLRVVS